MCKHPSGTLYNLLISSCSWLKSMYVHTREIKFGCNNQNAIGVLLIFLLPNSKANNNDDNINRNRKYKGKHTHTNRYLCLRKWACGKEEGGNESKTYNNDLNLMINAYKQAEQSSWLLHFWLLNFHPPFPYDSLLSSVETKWAAAVASWAMISWLIDHRQPFDTWQAMWIYCLPNCRSSDEDILFRHPNILLHHLHYTHVWMNAC